MPVCNNSDRKLTPTEQSMVQETDYWRSRLGKFIARLEQDEDIDKNWLAVAKQELQLGFMSLDRAITKPSEF